MNLNILRDEEDEISIATAKKKKKLGEKDTIRMSSRPIKKQCRQVISSKETTVLTAGWQVHLALGQ